MKLIIEPDFPNEVDVFEEHHSFADVSNEDLNVIRDSIQKVADTGIAHLTFFIQNQARKKYLQAELNPEFNSAGKVSKIIITLRPITKNILFRNSTQSVTNTFTEYEDFHAIITFDSKLDLKEYFTSSALSFDEVFSNYKARIVLKKWLRNLPAHDDSTNFSISRKDTGHIRLIANLIGINSKTNSICIRIESGKENSLFDQEANITQLKKEILNIIPADIAVWNVNHQYIFLNKVACPNEETRQWLINKDDFEYCSYRGKPMDIAIRRRDTFNKMLLSGKQASMEEQFDNAEGTKYHLRIFEPLFDSTGKIGLVLGYGLDITAIKQMQSTLTKMSLAVEDAMDGIGVLDPKGKYIYVNESHIQMFGYQSQQDFIGKTWHMLYETEEIKYLENTVFPKIANKGRWEGITKGKLKNGTTVYQEITLTALPDGGLICICRDKTKERNDKLRLEKAAIVADNTSSVIIITNPQDKIQWVNKAFTDVLGYTMEEVLGKVPTFLHGLETDKKTLNKIFKQLMNKKGYSGEILNYSKKGVKFWMQINATPIFNSENELVNFISVANDITSLKTAEEKIKINLQREKELNELKSQFVSIASHEIRTPLASIQSSTDLIKLYLEKEVLPKGKVEIHLNQIEGQITRLSSIMSNLLTVGRINLGKFDLHKRETDIESFIKKVLKEFYTVTSDGRNVIFQVTGNKKNSCIDKVLMSQVIINLVSNAIKYSAGKTNPYVKLDFQPEYYTISVKDEGIGIPNDQHTQIFSSFFRAGNVDNIQGTGLGLVIVKKFVEMHNGKISFQSIMGNGTTFEVKLPYQ